MRFASLAAIDNDAEEQAERNSSPRALGELP